MLDVIIIGAGPAGLSAGLWCAELGLEALVLEQRQAVGGQLLWIHNPIENHLGVASAGNGNEMRDAFIRQISNLKFEIQNNVTIKQIDLEAKQIRLPGGERLQARSLIIATGLRRRQLGVPGEMEFRGRGIMVSGRRDRHLFAGKDVCVVGGGDAAAENALLLAEVCRSVALVHRGKSLRARESFVERLAVNNRITVLTNSIVRRISGEREVEGVEIVSGSDEAKVLPVSGVLVRTGYEPNTELFSGQLQVDKGNYVRVTSEGETSIREVFAVGDVANPLAPTISGAIGTGATAAKVLYERLHRASEISNHQI